MIENAELKLFVVGESSGNPDDWSEFGGYELVIARGPQEAMEMAVSPGPATEVSFDKPRVLSIVRASGRL